MTATRTDLPAAISAAMASRGFTLLALARATGIPRTTLIRRLKGGSPLLMCELEAICETLDVKVSDMFTSIEVSA